MYRKYYSYNDMPKAPEIRKTKAAEVVHPQPPVHNQTGHSTAPAKKESKGLLGDIFSGGKLFGRFETDDILLLVVILILLMDDCDDSLLLLAVAFIFLSGL